MMTKPTDKEREEARKEFYRIVTARLESRIERGEEYTTTKDLYKGYEALHAKGFTAAIPPSQTVSAVLNYARFRDCLYYARDIVTHKALRSGGDRRSPYRVYLRADATPPTGYALVPAHAKESEIGEYIAAYKGAEDATVHVTRAEVPPLAPETPPEPLCPPPAPTEPPEALIEALTGVIRAQADIISSLSTIRTLLPRITRHTNGLTQ